MITTCYMADHLSNRIEFRKDVKSNGDGSYVSDKRLFGDGTGSLALTPDEKKELEIAGWHDTGLINGHGQPMVQNNKGEILSVCRLPKVYDYCKGVKIQ